MEDVRILVERKFAMVTPEEWNSLCNKTKQTEQDYIENEHAMNHIVDNTIINLDSSDTGSEDFEIDSDDSDDESDVDNPLYGVKPLPSD